MDEFLEQFLLESRELVEQASADLLALEENPSDTERLEGAFRAFHTLKGSAAIVDFAVMASVTHVVEELLARVRKGQLSVTRSLITDCLTYLNIVAQWLEGIGANGEIPAGAQGAADVVLKRLVQHTNLDEQSTSGQSVSRGASNALLETQLELLRRPGVVPGVILSAGKVTANVLDQTGRESVATVVRKQVAEAAASGDTAALVRLLSEQGDKEPAPLAAPGAGARVLRVDVTKIDDIVRLTGELMVAKNALGHAASLAGESSDPVAVSSVLREQYVALGRLSAELQRAVLAIRVLPMRFVFQRFPRLIRDTAESLEKSVKLEISGEETEADKVIVENLFEPLLHVLRNALDHGIEPAEARATSGKPAVATIRLEAVRKGDKVVVQISDDGRGIDLANVRRVALERNVIGRAGLETMSDEEVMNLIFAPGFSTASTVTSLSGRGVGMNAVRAAVERLGGTVSVVSQPGVGTSISLILPFSILMTRIMTVYVGGQVFGIPFDNIVETARIPREGFSNIGAGRAFALRDRTIPVIDLCQSLGMELTAARASTANLVVVSLAGQIGSVEVDRLGVGMDVMLRPPEGLLAGVPGVAGTSLSGDGTVLIVLDLQELLG